MPYPKEKILETFEKLPEDVREAMFSVDTAMVIQEIRQKHKLMIDKMGELADETGLVMLGFTHPKDYIPHLTERLAVSREVAKEIAEEVNSRVFFSVRERLKKIHGLEEAQAPKDFQGQTLDLQKESPAKDRPLEIPKVGPWQNQNPPAPASPTPQAPPKQGIFETKTKDGIFRAPAVVSEKTEPQKPGLEILKRTDPYRELTNREPTT